MTSTKETIRAEMTAAMKAGDKVRVSALRLLMASITNREKEVMHELSDEEVAEVAGKEVKKRNESIEAFEAGGRQELADRERAELTVIEPFAPSQMSEQQIDAIIDEVLASTGASGPQDIGKVMGPVMAQARGRADGKIVRQKVSERLEG
jgi:uncharacterized protein